ncbi:leucyl/phenylalanyl-tRNA--protein transferase [Simiduia sp. 21SJ11W-1]|uniref:leucyl/phenylalanyl-tRNA--protein transferase n=1 Tax=Simiduia sp. 21SJ11W-1 TaxID=2909669 RepID=UPI0020A11392|nr:leucyl/phenylalanyl-tRNA--protein transferase [Simiduia sp. 21SJ11W-1]UTA49581.1 leucyl/phenylalanyl-tRNA--protein transferase [Simiduia sp. 21SJ11W-1]
MIPWLPPDTPRFPPTHTALKDPNGLLAAGGALTPAWLLLAYRHGIFPWFDEEDVILWWSPAPRMVLLPARVHISRSLRKAMRKDAFEVRFDTAFKEVIGHCASLRKASGTWILPSMQQAYCTLHALGYAHSVEIWLAGELVGGLYGVCIGGQFFGESMFSLHPNASKVALVALARHAEAWGIQAIDCQMHTDHLASMGAELYDRQAFEAMLKACDLDTKADWRLRPELMHV